MSSERRPPTQINIDDGFSITAWQMETLVGTIGKLVNFRGRAYVEDDDGEGWKKLLPKPLDGGGKVALEVAICAAADRLTSILQERPRWNRQANQFRQQVEDLFDAQLETQTEARFNESLKRRPTHLFRPHFIQVKGGTWAAFLTDDKGHPSVIGAGPTPEAAAHDFDRAFLGGQSAAIRTPAPDHVDTLPEDREDSGTPASRPDTPAAGDRPEDGVQ